MNRLRTRPPGGVDDSVPAQIGIARRPGPEQVGLVSDRHVQRGAIRLGVHGDGTDPELAPRLATRIFVKAGTGRVFSPTVSLPDQLTVARVAAVPIVVLLFAWDFPNHAYWATAVFVVAMATDQIDGWLARRRGVSSALGKLLDPVADKVLVLAALVMLIGEGVAPAWMIALIVVREILVSGLRLAAVERGVVLGARDLGRAKTWAQALAATVAGLAAAGMWSEDVAWWALLAALVATWVSGLDYARVAPRVLRGENA